MKTYWDIVIVGAGPAGIATAIQLKRMGHEALLVERERIGGLLWNANLIENYPGFPQGISGAHLIQLFEKQLNKLDIKPEIAHIHNVINKEDQFILQCNDFQIQSNFVVISTGTHPRDIPLSLSSAIRSSLHQDLKKLANSREKNILIIGGGEAALDQAISLSKNNRVTILNRNAYWNAFPHLENWVESIPQITCFHNTSVYNIAMQPETDDVTRVRFTAFALENGKRKFEVVADEILYAIGREPEVDLCKDLIQNNRVFFCGDVHNGKSRQVAIAIGEGIKTAMEIHQMMLEK